MTDLTPSETLRAAAERLRAMAAKATDGPWRWNGSQVDVEPTTRGTYVVGDGQQEDDVVTPEDGAWIATMSPVVAEPLAAWLEAEGSYAETTLWERKGTIARAALAFARSILEQP
jgi:hypothetical protein